MSLDRFRNCSFAAVLLTVTSLVLEPCHAWATQVAATTNHKASTTAPSAVRMNRAPDVALKTGGVLQGQVLSGTGAGEKDVVVHLTLGKQQWQAKTDEEGWFRFTKLRGGHYQFRIDEQTQTFRAWAPGTAPPNANQGLLVAPSKLVVRGQRVLSPNTNQFFRVAKDRLSNPLVVSGVIVTAVAIPVAIHNTDDDDPPATP